jgi:hypothetical protein
MQGVGQDQEPGEPGRAAHPRLDVVRMSAWLCENADVRKTDGRIISPIANFVARTMVGRDPWLVFDVFNNQHRTPLA